MTQALLNQIAALIEQDPLRTKILECVAQLDLPQCYVAAGFVRNLVWDHLHGFDSRSTILM